PAGAPGALNRSIVTSSTSTESAIARFQDWQQRYLAAPRFEREALEAEGLRVAAARRGEFKQLIATDPREALSQAVPMVVRQELPASVLELLEERLNGVAVLRVYQ